MLVGVMAVAFLSEHRFEYGFKFAEKIELEIIKIGFRDLIETAEAVSM
jgi:hypothetical protein